MGKEDLKMISGRNFKGRSTTTTGLKLFATWPTFVREEGEKNRAFCGSCQHRFVVLGKFSSLVMMAG